jgi:hypothetical protein
MRRRVLVLTAAFVALSLGSAVAGGAASAAAETPIPIECEGDSCQPLPAPPEEPALGTAFLTPEVNPPPRVGKPAAGGKGHHRPHHHAGGRHHPKKGHRPQSDRNGR